MQCLSTFHGKASTLSNITAMYRNCSMWHNLPPFFLLPASTFHCPRQACSIRAVAVKQEASSITASVLVQSSDLRAKSVLLDYDSQWAKDTNFVHYDFNNPEDIPSNIQNSFDCVVIDPPFITEEVWILYATAAKLLLKPSGSIMLTTIPENAPFLKRLLGVEPQAFRPAIPHLVYQYCIFTNYSSEGFAHTNPEVQEDKS